MGAWEWESRIKVDPLNTIYLSFLLGPFYVFGGKMIFVAMFFSMRAWQRVKKGEAGGNFVTYVSVLVVES